MTQQIERTEAEWRAALSPMQYDVLRREVTERAGTGRFNTEKRAGVYRCAGCHTELFTSDTKYESGCGWPSFHTAMEGQVGTKKDRTLFMVRTEIHCGACGGHLGHVFEDGPPPTGLRYCVNSASLEFVADGADEAVPGARDV